MVTAPVQILNVLDNQRLERETMSVEKMHYYKMFANADQIRNFTSCLNLSSEGWVPHQLRDANQDI
jgi:hypothetical protein